ncbi:exocyst complex [Plasmopara halstedii]|uniref:Exocyst complex n=1 Tax=Plasmopara halstedii TaxID=4781 RepID=A0A0P1A6T4_PLAHL|nr:exocyst complex [Plasmopara halstedii]CEG36329.1 exocyst complex [Plasmopara halstedii]|eukprot:XP_024572698.1 exocyst complex [Plasmopara halstedii]
MESSVKAASSAWQSKPEWVLLAESIAQSRARLAPGIQLAIEKQWGNKFTASLQNYAKAKEDEIRDVCSSNYQDFVVSIEEIVRMKADVSKLQLDIDEFQSQLAGATSKILSVHDSLATCYTVQKNIDESIEKLQHCQRILALAAAITAYIEKNKLFHAFTMLEKLRIEIAAFRGRLFPQYMNDWMHDAMRTIKDEAKREASHWLEDIRTASLSIGEAAMHRLENQISEQYYEQDVLEKCGHAPTTVLGRASSSGNFAVSPRASLSPSNSDKLLLGEDGLKLPSIRVFNSGANTLKERSNIHANYMKLALTQLSPMLRILHVFRVTNQLSELAAFYNVNRLPQLQLTSFLRGTVTTVSPEKFVTQHEELFKKLTGSFCLEHLLWRYSDAALLSKKDINGIFHLVIQSLCGIVSTSVLSLNEQATILNIKVRAIACARTLSDEVHEYNSTLIFDTFRRLGSHFRNVIMANTKKRLREFMASDTFERAQVSSDQLQMTLQCCGLENEVKTMLKNVDVGADPVVLPFTSVVVKSCKSIEALIQMMFDYERYLNIEDWGEWVRDDTIEALSYLNETLNEVIDQHTDLQVATVVMMGTNASFLACACDRFEENVKMQTEAWEARTYGYSVSNTLRGATTQLVKPCSSRLQLSKAAAKKKFTSTTTRAQDMVCELMLKKIDELLSSFYYLNWMPSAVLTQPDPSMWDLINYLKVTFAQLHQLPQAVQEAVHFASCSYLAKSLEQILSGSAIKKLNMEAIANFKRNLDVLLDYIGSVPIAQLQDCFIPVLHLIELFLSGGVEEFLDPQQRDARGKYSHLSSDTVSAILAKMKDGKNSSKAWGPTFVHAPKKRIFGSINPRK